MANPLDMHREDHHWNLQCGYGPVCRVSESAVMYNVFLLGMSVVLCLIAKDDIWLTRLCAFAAGMATIVVIEDIVDRYKEKK